MRIVVAGGGWAGCAASLAAKKCGAEVVLIEKTDMLLGLGNVGGIIRNNGRYTAAEEMIALGGGELFETADSLSRHTGISFPGHEHASLYDVTKIEAKVRRLLIERGVEIHFEKRITGADKDGNNVTELYSQDEDIYKADAFVETTGSAGPMGNCMKYGMGCSMCILRCPSYGPRISITKQLGIEDYIGMKEDDSFGAVSGSCKLCKESLSYEIRKKLDDEGVVIIPIPKEDINREKLKMKVCQQYALDEFAENVILLDTGHAKLMTSYYPLEKLRKLPGLEDVRFEDPYSGGRANSIRYLAMSPRDNSMKVRGLNNIFVAGEKSGLFVGHTEAIITGTLAGYNSCAMASGKKLLELPDEISCGDIISEENKAKETADGLKRRFTFAGSEYFKRMQERGLYTIDKELIRERIRRCGLENIFAVM